MTVTQTGGTGETNAIARQTLRGRPPGTENFHSCPFSQLVRVADANGIARERDPHKEHGVGQAPVPEGMSLPLKPQRIESLRLP